MKLLHLLLFTLVILSVTQNTGSNQVGQATFSTQNLGASNSNLRTISTTSTSSSSSSSSSSASSTLPPLRILLTVNARNQILLSPSLLTSEGTPIPLVGFTYNYTVNNLPSWASFSRTNNSIILTPPTTWNNQISLNIAYTDSKGNSQTLIINLSPASFQSQKTYDFLATNTNSRVQNYQTVAFPLFSGVVGVGGRINVSNLLSTQAYLVNVGKYPWTADVQIMRPGGVGQSVSSSGIISGGSSSTTTTTTTTTNSGQNNVNINNNQNRGNVNSNMNNGNIVVGFGGNNPGGQSSSNSQQTTTTVYSNNNNNNIVPGTVLPIVYQSPIGGQVINQQFTYSNPSSQSTQTSSSQNSIISVSPTPQPTPTPSPPSSSSSTTSETISTTSSSSSSGTPPIINNNPITIINATVPVSQFTSTQTSTQQTNIPQNTISITTQPPTTSNNIVNRTTVTTTTSTSQLPINSNTFVTSIPSNNVQQGSFDNNNLNQWSQWNQATTVNSPTNSTTTVIATPTSVPQVVAPINTGVNVGGFNTGGVNTGGNVVINETRTVMSTTAPVLNNVGGGNSIGNNNFNDSFASLLANLNISPNLLNSNNFQLTTAPTATNPTTIPITANPSISSLTTSPISYPNFLFSNNNLNSNLNSNTNANTNNFGLNLPTPPTFNLTTPTSITSTTPSSFSSTTSTTTSSSSQPSFVSPTVNVFNPSTGLNTKLPYSFPVGTDLSSFGLGNSINNFNANLNSLGLNTGASSVSPNLLSQLNSSVQR